MDQPTARRSFSATTLRRYRPIVLGTLAASFAAELARVLFWMTYGAPVAPMIDILIADLSRAPIVYVTLSARAGFHKVRMC